MLTLVAYFGNDQKVIDEDMIPVSPSLRTKRRAVETIVFGIGGLFRNMKEELGVAFNPYCRSRVTPMVKRGVLLAP